MTGVELIAAERDRQIHVEGFTTEHDSNEHSLGCLADAAATYAIVASAQTRGASAKEFDADLVSSEMDWPWDEKWWKPSDDPVRNLVKAGALIAAEIDRLNAIK